MAGPAKTGLKKNVNDKVRVRMLEGQKVQMCLYNGRAVGHGKYYAAMINNELLLDQDGKPLPFHGVGELVEV